jgi:hypothetical protein
MNVGGDISSGFPKNFQGGKGISLQEIHYEEVVAGRMQEERKREKAKTMVEQAVGK